MHPCWAGWLAAIHESMNLCLLAQASGPPAASSQSPAHASLAASNPGLPGAPPTSIPSPPQGPITLTCPLAQHPSRRPWQLLARLQRSLNLGPRGAGGSIQVPRAALVACPSAMSRARPPGPPPPCPPLSTSSSSCLINLAALVSRLPPFRGWS